jgi:eukaryotic-like serine/threonine-protein kinase
MDLDRYQLLVQLGAGRDGVAYRGTDTTDGGAVEIRDLSGARADPARWPLLVKRLRLAAQLEHPAAIRVLGLGLEHDPPCVALEWIGEANLGAAPHDDVPLPVPEALALAHTLADLLAAAHRLGLAHGRLDPGHLHGPGLRDPKLDFTGLDVHPVLGRESFRTIDASCRAPEVGDGGAPDGAADVYSLGALLSWLLTGEPAPDLRAPDLEVAAPLARLVRDMRATDPVERPSAREASDRLAALLSPPEAAQSRIDPKGLRTNNFYDLLSRGEIV